MIVIKLYVCIGGGEITSIPTKQKMYERSLFQHSMSCCPLP